MNNFNLNLFKYFYYVVYYNGFTNAAKPLCIAQSSLSYNIKKLEEEVDKILINRNSKTFQLTDEGNRLYENLKPVFNTLKDNIDYFSNSEETYHELNIGIRHNLSDFILVNAIKEFRQKFDNIKINIYLYSKLDISKINELYDLVIDYDYYLDLLQNVNRINLCELENIFVCGKELYNKYKFIDNIKALKNEIFVSFCPSRKKGILEAFCYNNGTQFRDVINTNDSALYQKMILENLGIGLVNTKFVLDKLNNQELFKINVGEKIAKDKIEIAFNNNYKKEYIDCFVNILKNNNKEES